jgi:hypothetical protein
MVSQKDAVTIPNAKTRQFQNKFLNLNKIRLSDPEASGEARNNNIPIKIKK